jgi:hypothetical protein
LEVLNFEIINLISKFYDFIDHDTINVNLDCYLKQSQLIIFVFDDDDDPKQADYVACGNIP